MRSTSDAKFGQIATPSVVDQIIETIKQALIRGELRPGERLPSEPELAQQLGVGRSAVREAMKIMEALGVVKIRHGSGTFVASEPSDNMLSPLVFALMLEGDMTIEFVDLRMSTQLSYCTLAAQNATAEDWQAIEDAARAFEQFANVSKDAIETLTKLDLNFHYAILEATNNPLIIKLGRTVEELFFTSIQNTLASFDQPNIAFKHHRDIIQAMRSGNVSEIKKAIELSLVLWRKEVEDKDKRLTLAGSEVVL